MTARPPDPMERLFSDRPLDIREESIYGLLGRKTIPNDRVMGWWTRHASVPLAAAAVALAPATRSGRRLIAVMLGSHYALWDERDGVWLFRLKTE
jgi:hypothetical protein